MGPLGLFAGSGVGKLCCWPRWRAHTACDVAVLALVGERGREVRFLEDDLGPAGLARSVVVVATSDSPPPLRRQAALAATTVAKHFGDQGKSVLLLMERSRTRALLPAELRCQMNPPSPRPRRQTHAMRQSRC